MARYSNNNRVTPDAVRDYNLKPAASVVDKQSKYTPQLGDAANLKNTAQGLADLARGATAVNIQLARMSSPHTAKAYAKTEDENKAKFAEVSRNIEGFGKFNPYNREVYKTLRADTIVGNAQLKYKQLAATCDSLSEAAFDEQVYAIQDEVLSNLKAENIKAKNSANALEGFQNTQTQLKELYVTKKAARDQAVTHNAMVTATAKTFATNAYNKEINYIDGWNDSVKKLTETADGLGINSPKQYELFMRSVNQYLTDNVDDIDAEDFMVAISQTKIGGKPLSDFDPNYATSMKQLLIKAKSAKYEMDSLDLKVEKLRLEKASMAANTEMFNFMADPNKTDAEILNKANEIIEAGGMEAIGMDYLKQIVNDKQTLFNLRTTQTKPEVYENLTQKFITKELTQEDIVNAVENKELGAKDASYLFNALNSDAQETYSEQFKAIKELYMDTNSTIDLGEQNKAMISKSVMDTISNPNLTKAQKAQALIKIKGVAEHMNRQQEIIKDKSPMKLLTAAYMDTQKAQTQDIKEAQRYLAQMGLFKNQINKTDSNIRVTSAMQQEREVTLSDGTTVKRRHNGTDVATYQGRQIYAPMTGKVVASGYEKSMGNYILFDCEGKGYIKLMHLQSAELPKANTYILKGKPLAYVGNTGAVSSKDGGVLHVECFDRRMRLVNPKQFIKGS